jgi:osmotically-inducible protein OsmY
MKTDFFKNILLLSLTLFGTQTWANSIPIDVDNSAINARDKGGQNLTAQDQSKGSLSDVEITRRTRQRLVRDTNLSTNGKNVKIMTINKVMTLRGPVSSQAEKVRIIDHAQAVSKSTQIIDNLEIRTH